MIDLYDFVEYRQFLYYLTALIAFLWALSINEQKGNSLIRKNILGYWYAVPLIIIYGALVGYRAYNVGADTVNYEFFWGQINSKHDIYEEYFFYYVMLFVKQTFGTYQSFLITISCIFFFFFFLTIRNFGKLLSVNILFIFFTFSSMFFFSSITINVMRQGLAIALVFYGFSVYITQKTGIRWIKIILAFYFGYLFHSTTLIPIAIMIASMIAVNIKLVYYYLLYAISIIASAAGVGIQMLGENLADLAGNRRAQYADGSNAEIDYEVGFKLKFVIFNTIFLFIFHYLIKLMSKDEKSVALYYRYMLIYYILSSVVFYMFFHVQFSDRVGLFAWYMIPFLFAPIFSHRVKIGNIRVGAIIFLVAIFFGFAFKDV